MPRQRIDEASNDAAMIERQMSCCARLDIDWRT